MNQLNEVILEGNLVNAPLQTTFGDNKKKCHLNLACNRYYKNREGETVQEASFFDVVAFGPLSEKVSMGEKGQKIRIEGHLKQQTWMDEVGKRHSKLIVIADKVDFEAPGRVINNTNNVILEGNLVKDPDQKITDGDKRPAKFSIATNRSFRKGEEWIQETSFIDVDAFGAAGKFASGLEKGQSIKIEGRLKQDRWKDGEGKTHSKISITADKVEKKRGISRKKEEPEMGR